MVPTPSPAPTFVGAAPTGTLTCSLAKSLYALGEAVSGLCAGISDLEGGAITYEFVGDACGLSFTGGGSFSGNKTAGSCTATIRARDAQGVFAASQAQVTLHQTVALTIASVSPSSGNVSGQDTIVVSGTELSDADVRVGGALCTSPVRTATSVTCSVPAGLAVGAVDVEVFLPTGQATISPGAFRYVNVFHVSPTGNDAADGRTPATAWKTDANVNCLDFGAGDRILFEGGKTFEVDLYFGVIDWSSTPGDCLSSNDQATATDPIVLGSYGSGKAILRTRGNADDDVLYVQDFGALQIRDLVFQGPGRDASTSAGLFFWLGPPAARTFPGPTFERLEISGFRVGISMGALSGETLRYDGVTLTSSLLSDLETGFQIYMDGVDGHSNVSVTSNTFSGITTSVEGRGATAVLLDGVRDAVVRGNLVAGGTNRCQGCALIDLVDSTRITVAQNELRDLASTQSGHVIGLKSQVTDSMVERNFVHDVDQTAVGLVSSGAVIRNTTGNTIRFNVATNASRNHSGVLQAWSDNTKVDGNYVHNNLLHAAPGRRALDLYKVARIHLFNNVFWKSGSGTVIQTGSTTTGSTLRYNAYYDSDGGYSYVWSGGTYSAVGDLSAGKSVELAADGTTMVGKEGNPQIEGPFTWSGALPATALSALTQFRLAEMSPLRGAGESPAARLGISLGTFDFFGNPVGSGAASIGPHQPALP